MAGVTFNTNQTTDSVTAGHEAKQGLQRMQQILGEAGGASRQPTMNEMHQEGLNAKQNQKDNIAQVAFTAAAGAVAAKAGWGSSSTNKVDAAGIQKEADKGAVAAKRTSGSTDESTSTSKTDTNIDYAAVYKKDLQGQLAALKNAPRTPENQAKHKELTEKIAAVEANTTSSASTSSASTAANSETPPTTVAQAKVVKSKLETEVKELENQQAVSPSAEQEDKLKHLKQDLNHVNRLLQAENTNSSADIDFAT